MSSGGFARQVIAWQRSHGRHALPWQRTRDPYRVWLSEIMLQQTQVATVLGYYERFLQRFPDVQTLAAAPQDDVLALWSGLGYYSRARNLHRCAQVVVAEHGGSFPADSSMLTQLPGIGRSTAAAIAAFCFGERVAILDGNVKRVLTRVLGFDGDLTESAQERALWSRATDLLPEQGIEAYTQGLMDLGATLCLARTPQCPVCPVRERCVAANEGRPERYPVKTRRLRRGTREHVWLWLRWGERIWLVQRPDRGVWAGLWSLPEFDSTEALGAASASWPGQGEALPSFTHVLTHLDWTLHPRRWTLPAGTPATRVEGIVSPWPSGRWFTPDEALGAGLPAPLRRLLANAR
ncbi:A/G-specific adenine glycosylase [uncultured Piscinibacter sp.]|uniref:A/G-specific adenine glycosylase n=1 Tax=uncultured Piscinibacter sp. TaxID=1131835 RepID=UPI00263868AE|nr:A/G-specific adenine glycosylase [uncultured Piscinibacter sp.]